MIEDYINRCTHYKEECSGCDKCFIYCPPYFNDNYDLGCGGVSYEEDEEDEKVGE